MRRALALCLALALLAVPCAAHAQTRDILVPLFDSQEWQARGDLEAARKAASEALAQDPGSGFAQVRLAQIDAASGNLAQALQTLDALLAREPGNLLARNWQGFVLLAMERPLAAGAAFRETLAKDPANGWGLLGRASALLAQGQDREAQPLLAKAQETALSLEDSQLHAALGQTFLGLGLPANARMELELALELSPRSVTSLELAGKAYMALGQEHLALNAWRQALGLDPANAACRALLVQALGRQAARLEARGNAPEARQAWLAVLGYDPANAQARDRLRAKASAVLPGVAPSAP
ncbi:Beta-barrel assembly-enhancing protease [Fundidesulfovibrio magnetotacticus]|uniref:Beta-barrel assembly-enhancing protease n=1 Tax=Fundidesulfovibrio magnetotacticus TaxID=2730080 RepID=A0A6V8LVF8_9BACT|nr:tetratricopeptide repeat protein [Fundidesulfovibrio magnetotacticus]GFK93657.1 Beta-barrel assembly-enhancing protease [Fundidesulfovibrio magnetotacticus]